MFLVAKCTVTQFSMQMAYYVLIRLGWLISKTKTLKFFIALEILVFHLLTKAVNVYI